MTEYHHTVSAKYGCGCEVKIAYGVSGDPDPATVALALGSFLLDPLFSAMMNCEHDQAGNEKIDIALRTKVGSIADVEGEEL